MATCLLFSAPFKPTTISPKPASKITCSSITTQSQSAKQHLLALISDQDRGLRTQNDPIKRSSIIQAIDAMAELGKDTVTTDDSLSATWRLLWTTEKEQLFIIEKAPLFGTQAGDVLQVIDVEKKTLNNVITFPPDGVFFVRSIIEVASSQRVIDVEKKTLNNVITFPPDGVFFVRLIVEVASSQRLNFRFISAVLRGKNWEIPLPPFGQGWFESVYIDEEIRVVKDIRGDYLVVDKAPYAWKE